MSDTFDSSALLAALPVEASGFGGAPCALAVIPCFGPPLRYQPYLFGEEL